MTYKRLFLPLVLLSACWAGPAYGQAWSGILAPTRAIDWSQAGVPGGLPNRTTICSTLSPGASISQVNNAISGCPTGQVVFLNAGNYGPWSTQINMKSGVTLRGAGPDKTFLSFSSVDNCNGLGGNICVWNGDSNAQGAPKHTADWTSGYSQGTTTITLSSTSGLQNGMLLYLDQLDYTSDPGDMWHCENQNSNPPCSQNGQGQWGIGRQNRGQQQVVLVTAVNGNSVTFTPGLYAPNWKASQSPGAWWGSSLPITGAGVEDLSLTRANAGHRGGGITVYNGYGNWVKNIRSLNDSGVTAHVFLYQSAHNTVRDSYFYGSNPAAEGYGIDSGYNSGDNLIENNITQHIATGLNTEGDTGSVFGYNYSVDNYFGGTWQQQDEFNHGHGTAYVLREGNEGIGFNADTINGVGCCGTHFRTFLSGRDPSRNTDQATFAYFPFAFQRYFNIVGSVLGTKNYHTHYEAVTQSATDGTASVSWKSVFVIGFADQGGYTCIGLCNAPVPNDPVVAQTLMRWGNYAACTGDAKCNTVRWDAGETSSAAPVYPGLSSPSQNLPASFYLSGRPGWWGAMPFPAIGPDVTGGNASQIALDAAERDHVYLNPAAECYFNVMGGKVSGSGALTFNANNCYTQTSQNRPAAPTNLSVVVQ